MINIIEKLLASIVMIAVSVGIAFASPQQAPMKMWRLDCGTMYFPDLNSLSDTYAFTGMSKTLSNGCYLIKHGSTYMLWDTGLGTEMIEKPLEFSGFRFSVTETIVSQLARLGLKPSDISIVAVSHLHSDHTGQAASFPHAKLLIGEGDLELIRQEDANVASSAMMHDAARLKPWLEDGAPLEAVVGDKDIFGDGSVVMLNTPGHTPGHHVLLVRLPKSGAFVLSGDLIHIKEQLATNEFSPSNTDRADTLASLKRVHAIVENLNGTLIIQHEPADIAKLPAFPEAAE